MRRARFARAEGVGLPEREARTRRAARGRARETSPKASPKLWPDRRSPLTRASPIGRGEWKSTCPLACCKAIASLRKIRFHFTAQPLRNHSTTTKAPHAPLGLRIDSMGTSIGLDRKPRDGPCGSRVGKWNVNFHWARTQIGGKPKTDNTRKDKFSRNYSITSTHLTRKGRPHQSLLSPLILSPILIIQT